jgi:hypothetical protein
MRSTTVQYRRQYALGAQMAPATKFSPERHGTAWHGSTARPWLFFDF